MKGVIFSSLLWVAGPAAAAVVEWPMAVADLEQVEAQRLEMAGVQERESLLREARRSQNEALLRRQMRLLELFRQQAEKARARAEKLKQMVEQSSGQSLLREHPLAGEQ